MDSDLELTPPELREAAVEASTNLLPAKSRERYEKTFAAYNDWATKKGVTHVTENVLLAYFNELSVNKKPSTLWATYSMLKTTISLKNNIDISKFPKLQAFLKIKNTGYKPKKSKVFTRVQVQEFLDRAPEDLLAIKVALIIGVSGACRSDELFKMRTNDVDVSNQRVSVLIPDTKTYNPRSFVIIKPGWVEIIRHYVTSRSSMEFGSDRFFLQYRCGRLTRQPLGHNSVAKFPQKIAAFLGLADQQCYTGHCFRRTAATFLANIGGDILQLKRLGGWRSNSVAEGYVENALDGQVQIATLLTAPPPIREAPSTIVRPSPASTTLSPPRAPPFSTPSATATTSAAVMTSTSKTNTEYNFTTDEIQQGLSLTINSHDHSQVVINFNNIVSNPQDPVTKDIN